MPTGKGSSSIRRIVTNSGHKKIGSVNVNRITAAAMAGARARGKRRIRIQAYGPAPSNPRRFLDFVGRREDCRKIYTLTTLPMVVRISACSRGPAEREKAEQHRY